MERENVANTILWPVDMAFGLALQGIEKAGLFGKACDLAYVGLSTALRKQFETLNELEVEGTENVPESGGMLFASNHQSWLDVQILGASSPRRVHYIAKSEFKVWPVLRHLIKLSQSVFVERTGDDQALETITEKLQEGWAVAIYPEATIPGEEDIPRSAVEPHTGLLRGKTGVARLALAANVPIVPVGVSGTGRALPPEIYPRLELLRAPGNTPIKIRYGKPISMEDYAGREHNRELFREVTDRLMGEISGLVDHSANYIPIDLPIPEIPTHDKIGVLLLHGFTSHLNTVNGLVPHLEKAGIDYEMPVLRGHGTKYQDLKGVTARDWYEDAEDALLTLSKRVDKVVVVGLSMGGLVSIELGTKHADKIAGLVTVAAALEFVDPLARFSPAMAKVVKFWPSPESFNDKSLKVNCENYPKFATDAFASLYDYSREISGKLAELELPISILQSKRDQIVKPESANLIYEGVNSAHREILWYQESGHEMMQDMEADQVFADIMEKVLRYQKA